jgi:hypothetical protein
LLAPECRRALAAIGDPDLPEELRDLYKFIVESAAAALGKLAIGT